MKWSGQNKTAMQNWFGLYCDHCGKIIPCVINLTSLILLVVTAPLWYGFKEPLKRKWLGKQPARYEKLAVKNDTNTFAGYGWIKEGLSFGFFMFIVMTFISNPLLMDENPFTWRSLVSGLISWLVGGLLYGLIMKLFIGKTKQTQYK